MKDSSRAASRNHFLALWACVMVSCVVKVLEARTATSTVTKTKNCVRRDFFVNGKKIHLVGGAWVPDLMLQNDSLRIARELQLVKNANMNLVRIWGGGVTPSDIFFDLCDRLGLLVWSDFWVTGDTQGEFKGSPDWPLEGNVFVKNVLIEIENEDIVFNDNYFEMDAGDTKELLFCSKKTLTLLRKGVRLGSRL